jgi:hypothetical protein
MRLSCSAVFFMKIWLRTTFPTVNQHNNSKTKCQTRMRKDIDYRQLHLFSSTVLYDTASKGHEKRLISKLGTVHPSGINERFSYV